MGDVPAWYGHFRAADRLHCSPWELLDPDDPTPRSVWLRLAVGVQNAENYAASVKSGR